MLSESIHNTRQRYADYVHGGITLSPAEVELLVLMLMDWESQCRQLELSTIAVPLTLNASHLTSGKVIPFPKVEYFENEEDGVAS